MFNYPPPPPNRSPDYSLIINKDNDELRDAIGDLVDGKNSAKKRDDELETSTIAENQESSSGSDNSGK